MSALPHFSDVDLLGYGQRVIDLNSEIAVLPELLEDFPSFYRSR